MKVHSSKHVVFQDLKPGEEVKLFLRRHNLVLWKKVSLLFLVALIPVVIWIFLATQTDALEYDAVVSRVLIILFFSVFYLYWMRLTFTVWLDYYLDVWVVTTERILNINHDGLFHRKVSQQRLSRVQDVTTETKGWLQTLLHFGDIHVQTAAETEHFIFEDIEYPEDVAQMISELHSAALQKEFAGTPGDEHLQHMQTVKNPTTEQAAPQESNTQPPTKPTQ